MTINCQVCGTANPDSNKYCDGCGVELTNNAPAGTSTAAETSATPSTPISSAPINSDPVNSAPMSEVTPPDTAVSIPAPDAPTMETPPATPMTTPESLPGGAAAGTTDSGTIGAGTAPNPYQTPLSETMIGQMDAASAPVSTPAPAAPSAPAEMPAPMDTAQPPVEPAAPASPSASAGTSTSTAAARLGLKKFGQPTGDFIPLNGEKLVVGRFDASSGPVDIDLGEMAGKEHISRHHAELYVENGAWHVRDLGSTNGVFLKKKGEATFSPRLQEPAALADGDELAFGNVMLTFNQG